MKPSIFFEVMIILSALMIHYCCVKKFSTISQDILIRRNGRPIQLDSLDRALRILLKRKLRLDSDGTSSIDKNYLTIKEDLNPNGLLFQVIFAHEVGHGISERNILSRIVGSLEMKILSFMIFVFCCFSMKETTSSFFILWSVLTILAILKMADEIIASYIGFKILKRFFLLKPNQKKSIYRYYLYAFGTYFAVAMFQCTAVLLSRDILILVS